MKLKPDNTYYFTDADYQFIIELAKVGAVHILSHQVELMVLSKFSESVSISFKEAGCNGLKLPDNLVIEFITTRDNIMRVTFGLIELKRQEEKEII